MNRISKTATEVLNIEIEYARAIESVWRAGTSYSSGDYIRPTVPNGYEYQATTTGQSGVREPKWSTTIDGTASDGSVTWAAKAFSTNATDTISTVNLQTPTGITTGSATIDGTKVIFAVSGGTNQTSYVISCEATTSASEVIEEKVEVFVGGA